MTHLRQGFDGRARAAALTFALIAAAPASAQVMPCALRDDAARALRDGFGEVPVAIGVTPSGRIMELFASAARTWTLVVTTPDGVSCVVLAGEGYEPVLAAQPGKGA